MDYKTIFFLNHILENIVKAESFSKGMTKEELSKNEFAQYAIVRAIEVIGEAAKNLPDSFKKEHPKIVWKDIIGTRDIMIHKYFGVDLNIVWDILSIGLPDLKKKINALLKET